MILQIFHELPVPTIKTLQSQIECYINRLRSFKIQLKQCNTKTMIKDAHLKHESLVHVLDREDTFHSVNILTTLVQKRPKPHVSLIHCQKLRLYAGNQPDNHASHHPLKLKMRLPQLQFNASHVTRLEPYLGYTFSRSKSPSQTILTEATPGSWV